MPLELLGLLVAVSLAIVIAAVHLTGGRRTGALDDETVRAIWQREWQEEAAGEVIVADDRKTAFLLEEGGGVGVVRQMGAHHIARRIEAGTVARTTESAQKVRMQLRDTTLPRLRVSIANDGQRVRVVDALNALMETDDA